MDISILRPWALVFLVPAVLFCRYALRTDKAWLGVVDGGLLPSLMKNSVVSDGQRGRRAALIIASIGFLCALAGVNVRFAPNALYEPKAPAVIVLDMSLSMKARDVLPNRFSRAVFKAYDVLDGLRGIPVGLIVYTDEPYSIVPATTEHKAIKDILPLLNFSLLPSQGTRIDRALTEAVKAVNVSGAEYGDIFLITDGGEETLDIQDKAAEIVKAAAKKGFRLFVFGTGTTNGAPLFQKDDIPLTDALGNPVTHRLKDGWLKALATAGNGTYRQAVADGTDVERILAAYRQRVEAGAQSDLNDKESKADEGYWFILLSLVVFLFWGGKGGLVVLMFAFPSVCQADALAYFLSPSMAATRFIDNGNPVKAIETATKSGDFTALYNTGTRLIFMQNYEQAVYLLEQAVAKRPEDENAQINLEIARRLNRKPPSDSPDNPPPNGADNPDESGDGEGDSEGENNLNQNDKSDNQNDENKENSSDENGNDGGAEDNGDGTGGGVDGSADNDDGGADDRSDNLPVHEDPSLLLRYKIMFLYQENRYAGEPKAGAAW